jgi:hypothetical protein
VGQREIGPLLKANLVTKIDEPVTKVAERLRKYVIHERFFSEREGQFLFHGAVSETGFSLIPVVVQLLIRAVKPWPVHIYGEFEASGSTTTVRTTVQVDSIMYWMAGAFIVGILGMLVYSITVVPEVTAIWLLMYLSMLLVVVGITWLYSRSFLRGSKRMFQNAIRGDKELWPS